MSIALTLMRYRFVFEAVTTLHFPAYAGSTWRGALGVALREVVCVTREPTCARCLLARSCAYHQIFETPAGQEPLLAKMSAAPHPYVVQPLGTSGRSYQAGETLAMQVTLLGAAQAHLPVVTQALRVAGERGIGKGAGRCRLVAVEPVALPPMLALPARVRVSLHTPLRLLQANTPIRAERFTAQVLVMTLLRRLSLLHAYHAGEPLAVDFKALSALAAGIRLDEVQLRWHEWARYSNRQQSKVQMDGLLGSFVLEGDALAVFWAYLWWGQWVQVGKGTVMGLGAYSLAAC
jgi:CRISPR/Cas system endoribonuclease Cas6 (RAMP superfamily)